MIALAASLAADTPLERATRELAAAPPATLRLLLEECGRPLGAAGEEFADRLAARPDRAGREFAVDFRARLAPPRAAATLAAMLRDPDPTHADLATRVLDALAFVPDHVAIPAIENHLRAQDATTANNARRAAQTLAGQLLAEARTAEAADAYVRFATACPTSPELVLAAAVACGVYSDPPDRELAESLLGLEPRPGIRFGPLGAAHAERAAVPAMIDFFAGDSASAVTRLEAGLAALGPISPALQTASLVRVRLLLDLALTHVCAEAADGSAARAALREALAAAPHDDSVCLFDSALFGAAGPRAWLDRLRRTGRPEARRAFYTLLADEQARVAVTYSQDDEQPARSWVPVWRGYALLEDGDLAGVLATTTALALELAHATAWNDRWMRAECELLAGIATHLQGDPTAALPMLTAALRRVDELAGEEIDYVAEESREIVPAPGAPPLRGSLREVEARVARAAAEAFLAGGRPRDALVHAVTAARADPFSDAAVLLELALKADAGSDLERARRAFESFPREAGALLELARLAFALGKDTDGEELFARHLAWNALTPERHAVESRRRELDPTLRPRGTK